MSVTSVILMGMTPMAAGLVRVAIAADSRLVGELQAVDVGAAMRAGADAILTSLTSLASLTVQTEADLVAQLAVVCPLRVVGVTEESGTGTLSELHPRVRPLGELGVRLLVDTLADRRLS